ncbi:MAG TPA: hypothetical protein VH143_33400 [Kofleriaceae bacterium]|jgi:hypothetical protein|nr:hypothetical protein [Kofleriaceae bacterium]
MRRVAIAALVGVGVWLTALVVIGVVVGRAQPAKIATRLGESLQGSASIADVDLALVRGELAIEGLAVHRDDAVGHLALTVPDVRCELPPLGGALFDRGCRELAVRGVKLEISSLALFHLHHAKHPPVHADHITIDAATLEVSPSAILPELGKVTVRVDRAEAAATTLRTPLSWVCAMTFLDATIELPAGISLHLTYANGQLGAAGSLFGASPVVVPVDLPQAADDPRDEIHNLVAFGERVAEQLVEKRAADWLGAHL